MNSTQEQELETPATTAAPEQPAQPNSIKLVPLPKHKKIKWIPFSFIVGMHIGALLFAIPTFSWKALLVCVVLHWLTGGIGITLTYHRLMTHKSFKVPKILEYFLSIIASLACQGGPISWVSAHRLHHARSDQDGDPHSPKDGVFWAHMGWCLYSNKNIDYYPEYSRFAPDLAKDPIHVFLDRVHIVWTFLLAAGLYAWGGWPFVVWGICVRTVLVYHCTWLVNSAAHIWGYRTYDAKDKSTNLWWVALLTYGEGWHNNHHAFQYSARHGLKWWEFDTTYMAIKVLEFFGLATAIKLPPQRLLDANRA